MTSRTLRFVFSQPRVVLPGLIGLGLMLIGIPKLVGFILLAISAMRVSKLLGYGDLDDRLRLREDKRAHGVRRRLTDGEREEIEAIDDYCTELRDSGADAALVDETLSQGWQIIRSGGGQDQQQVLRRFRTQLPDLDAPNTSGQWQDPDLQARLEREAHLLRATRREVELTAAS